MSGVMKPYIVRQGEYLAKLAFVHGFDAETVWGDAKNEDLKKLRPDPNILAPGDILYIPDKGEEPLAIEKGVENSYAAEVPKVEVTIVFRDLEGPLANEPFELRGAVASGEPTTDADGKVTLTVAVTVSEVEILFPQRHESYLVRVGNMDPVAGASGVHKRLANLGYLHRQPGISVGEMLPAALWSFQAEHEIEPTGTLDDATRAALTEKHGR